MIFEMIRWTARAPPLDVRPIKRQSDAFNHNYRCARRKLQQARMRGTHRFDGQGFLGRRHDLPAALFVHRVEKIAKLAGLNLEKSSKAQTVTKSPQPTTADGRQDVVAKFG